MVKLQERFAQKTAGARIESSEVATIARTKSSVAGEPVIEPPVLPRVHRPSEEPRETFLGRLSRLFGQHRAPVAAVMIGMTPAMVLGAPLTAQAAPAIDIGHFRFDEGTTQSAEKRFGLDAERFDELVLGAAHQGQALRLAGMQQALLRQYLTLHDMPKDAPPAEIQKRTQDLQALESTIQRLDTLLRLDEGLPGSMLNDLESLTKQLVKADLGAAEDVIAAINDGSGQLSQARNALRTFIDSDPASLPAKARAVMSTYSSAAGGVTSALPASLPFTVTLPAPIVYTDPTGATLTIGAGAKIGSSAGRYKIEAPSILYSGSGVDVTSSSGTIYLGNGPDVLSFDTLSVDTKTTDVDLEGASAVVDRGKGTALIKADKATIDLSSGIVKLEGGRLAIDEDGSLHLKAKDALWTNGASSASAKDLAVDVTDDALTASASSAEAITSSGGSIVAKNVTFSLTDAGDDDVVTLHLDQGSYQSDDLEVALGTTDATIVMNKDGSSTLSVTSKDLTAITSGGTITTEGTTTLLVAQDKDGDLTRATFTASSASYTGASNYGQGVTAAFDDVKLTLNTTDTGQVLTASGQNGELDINGNKVTIDAVDTLTITTNDKGKITGVDAAFPGTIKFDEKNGEVTVTVLDAEAHLDATKGTHLTASFKEAEVLLNTSETSIKLTGGALTATDTSASLHVDSVEIKKALEKELNLEILDVSVDVQARKDGSISSVDLQAGSVIGNIKTAEIIAKTKDGDRLRLHLETTKDGSTIKSAFLLIPEGGEVQINDKDLELKLGPQLFSFENSGGVYKLRDDGIDIQAKTKDAEIKVKGGSAEIHLDKKTGDLIIHEITGTKVDIKSGSVKVNVDIQEVRGFLVKASGISGQATGMQIRLIPTSDSSVMNAEVKASISGIPVSLKLKNVHELEALGEMSLNKVHFKIGDPSGQGKVTLGVGPLSMHGSTIEAIVRYQTYDPARMTSLLGRWMSDEGFPITKNLSIDPDAVVRLKTSTTSSVAAEAAVILPRGTGSMPLYLLDLKDGAKDAAPGVMLKIGPRFGAKTEKSVAPTLSLGLVPGSYIDWHQVQGDASLFGVPLAKNFQIPSTAVGAVSVEARRPDLRVSGTVGGFVNPASFAPEGIPLYEPIAGGGFAGLKVEKNNFTAAADAMADVTKDGQVQFRGFRLSIGGRF
jgi:hypothetical protein